MLSKCMLLATVACFAVSALRAAETAGPVYESRIYFAAPGKLEALHARFRDHTTKLFEKHGMTNVGYWVPIENPDQKLIYVLAYPSQQAREQAWKGFLQDPQWQAAHKASEVNGPLVARVETHFLQTTDYSPLVEPDTRGHRVFELRVYKTPEGRLPHLHARFRDHTMKLFAKHGMTNLAYFSLLEGQPGADTTLVYLLAHESVEQARKSFDAFRQDPDWIAARTASEEQAGGSLTEKDGVQSTFLTPTDYSPWR